MRYLKALFTILSILLLAGSMLWIIRPAIQSADEGVVTPTATIEFTASPTANNIVEDSVPVTSKIAFADVRNGSPDIFVVNSDGTGVTNLTQTPNIVEDQPIWSADGSYIYFLGEGDNQYTGLYSIRVDTSETIKLFDWQKQISFYDVSPDGQWVVYSASTSSDAGNGICAIFKVKIDGSEVTQLTYEVGGDNAPSRHCDTLPNWSPNGDLILFLSNRDHAAKGRYTSDLYTMLPDGSEITQLTNQTWEVFYSRWSPDGQQISISSRYQSNDLGNIYLINADGSNLRQITNSTATSEFGYTDYNWFAWSPNGSQLAVRSWKNDSIGLIDLTTGQETYPLVSNTQRAYTFDWSPWLGGVPVTPTPTITPTIELTATATLTPTETPTLTPTLTLPTDTPTMTPTETLAPTDTPTPTPTETSTPVPTDTPLPATETPTAVPTDTPTPVDTPTPTATLSAGSVEDLQAALAGYCQDGQVDSQGVCQSLTVKVDKAYTYFSQAKPDRARQELQAFSQEVAAQRGQHITPEAADHLLALAEQLGG